MAKIKHVSTNEVHILKDSKTTCCGFKITDSPECWVHVEDSSKVTYEKMDVNDSI